MNTDSLHREWEVLRFVWASARKSHAKLTAAMVLEVAIGLFPAAAVYFVQDAIPTDLHGWHNNFSQQSIYAVLGVFFGYLLIKKITRVISVFAVADVENTIRHRYLLKLEQLPYTYISQKMDNRNAISLTQESAMASGLIPMVYRSFFRASATVVAFLSLMLYLSAQLTLIVLMAVLAIVATTSFLRNRLKNMSHRNYKYISGLHQQFAEWLVGYRILKVYGAIPFASDRMRDVFDRISAISKRLSIIKNSQSFFIEVLTYFVAAIFVGYISRKPSLMTVGFLISFPSAIMFIRNELISIINGYQQLASTESSISRIMDVLNLQFEEPDLPEWDEPISSIGLQQVSFSARTPLKSILIASSAKFEKGYLNVITGPSGAGKSTTLNLIMKLLSPDIGQVVANGKDIAGYSSYSLHRKMAIVEQEPFIFEGTLYENIALGQPIPIKSIENVCRRLALDDLLGVPELGMMIGSRNRQLSSGEKQRIALVRALVRCPNVLLLDEATSNIDYQTAQLIMDYVRSLSKQLLVICVSHDRLLIENSDRLYTLKYGKFFREQA